MRSPNPSKAACIGGLFFLLPIASSDRHPLLLIVVLRCHRRQPTLRECECPVHLLHRQRGGSLRRGSGLAGLAREARQSVVSVGRSPQRLRARRQRSASPFTSTPARSLGGTLSPSILLGYAHTLSPHHLCPLALFYRFRWFRALIDSKIIQN